MSISIYGAKLVDKTFTPVYSFNVLEPEIYSELSDLEGTPNPDYNPVLDVNLTNRNMRIVLAALNIELIEDHFHMNAKEFQARCVAWLRANIGKQPIVGFETTKHKNENGPTVFDCGISDGYLNKNIQRLSALASAVIEMGADIIYGG
jgi:hypothetical protein